MSERDNRQTVEAAWQSLQDQDWDGLMALFHENAEMVWPQTGEVIRGKGNCLSVLKNYPGGLPTGNLRRLQVAGDLATLEAALHYPDGSLWQQCTVFNLRDGKIARETDYWAQEMEAPEWRSRWIVHSGRKESTAK